MNSINSPKVDKVMEAIGTKKFTIELGIENKNIRNNVMMMLNELTLAEKIALMEELINITKGLR